MHALFYFLANDPSVPQQVQAAMQGLGLCKDEFTDNGGWPHQIYVREARRMIGQYVLTVPDMQLQTTVPDSIGVGGYPIDTHIVNVVNVKGQVEQECRKSGAKATGIYLIPYRVLTPQASQVTNLLVPVDASASHLAYDSLRVEVTYMIMGQAAGAAASIAIGQGSTIQNVPYSALQTQLLGDGEVIAAPSASSLSLSTTNMAFGSYPFGGLTNAQSMTLTNTGAATVYFSSISLSGVNTQSYLTSNNCGAALAVGASCTVRVRFYPQIGYSLPNSVVPGTLTITDSALNSPQSIALSGTGYNPTTVSLSATSLWFGSEMVAATSASQQVTLTNTGGATLAITSIGLTGANASSFVFANTCGSSLAAGANCTIHGHFTPVAAGALTAAVTITDSATGSPQSIALSGTGIGGI